MSFPDRSSRTKVAPPEVPTPGMAGGGKAKAMASVNPLSSRFRWSLMASYCSSGFFLAAHSSSVMKKKELYVLETPLSML